MKVSNIGNVSKNIFNADNNNDNFISISGSAGVGKTFLIIKIIV